MHTITAANGTATLTPIAVENYTRSLESRSVFHDTLDGGVGFVYVPPRPGSGSLTLIFLTAADAAAAQAAHTLSSKFLWTSEDTPEVGMTYAVDGAVTITPGAPWRVTIDYRVVVA